MTLKDIKTLKEVAEENDIHLQTLNTRLKSPSINMVEGEDFKKLGTGQSTILSPKGIKKILKKS